MLRSEENKQWFPASSFLKKKNKVKKLFYWVWPESDKVM
jgi:hypothetical protein